MAGSDNTLVSKSAWANRIQVLSKLHWAHLGQVNISELVVYSLDTLLFRFVLTSLLLDCLYKKLIMHAHTAYRRAVVKRQESVNSYKHCTQ
jgi:hypothetical protein